MLTLAAGLDYVDLNFLGVPEIIATAVLHGPPASRSSIPGPSTTHREPEAALGAKAFAIERRAPDPAHAHPSRPCRRDRHARAREPAIEVFVHERGAPHMIDPSKLLASAGRLYGADMDRLWGDFLPVPADRVER